MICEYTAKIYCNEDISLIENYDKAIADKEQSWDCHHRRESETSKKQLIEIGEYFKRPSSELIFLTHSEHTALHMKGKKCKPFTKEHKLKLSKAKKGKIFTEEHKRKIGENSKGRCWFNNGIKNVFAKSCPEGFVKGMIKEEVSLIY